MQTGTGLMHAVSVSVSLYEICNCKFKGPYFLMFSILMVLTLFLPPLMLGSLTSVETPHLGIFQGLSLTEYFLALSLCMCYHLLQEEAPLVMIKQGTYL